MRRLRYVLSDQTISAPDEIQTEEDAEDWIDRNQLGRRNLSLDDFRLILGRRYNRTKKAEHDGGKGLSRSGDQNDPHLQTADRLAEEHGVSAPTVKRAGKFAEAVEKAKEEHPEKTDQEVYEQANENKRLYVGKNRILKYCLERYYPDTPATTAVGGSVHTLLVQTPWMESITPSVFQLKDW